MLRLLTLLPFLLLFLCSHVHAQSWQWGKRGGSAQNIGSGNWEEVADMATDVNGNVYLLGHVAAASIDMDGQVKQGNGNNEVVLASYSCSGKLRWWKVIGGTSNDYAGTICADKQNGIYATFLLPRFHAAGNVKIDTDTSFSGISYTSVFMIKYDTAGNYKWLRCPQADTVTGYAYSNTGIIDMESDDNGNIFWLCQLPTGAFANGAYIVSTAGVHMLQYDRNGIFQGGFKMDMTLQGLALNMTKMTRDHRAGKFYIAGYRYDKVTIAGAAINRPKFVAAFDASGNNLWKRETGAIGASDGFYGKPVLDADKNIYLGGCVRTPDTFFSFIPDPAITVTAPIIAKLDSMGNLIWAKSAIVNGASFGRGGIALRNSGEVILHGSFPGDLSWPGYGGKFSIPPNTGYRPFITNFNTHTGKVLGMEQLVASVGTDDIVVRADGRNSVFIGGLFRSSLTVNGNKMTVWGGESDWFAAKYGYGCNCTNIPEPKFNAMANGQDVSFSYTGSAATSFKWYFGDGDSSTQNNPTHTYADNGNYIVCVTAVNACGDNTYCGYTRVFPTSVKETGFAKGVRVYPNPATSTINIEGIVTGTAIKLTDMMGRLVHSQTANSTNAVMHIDRLPKGIYILQLVNADGSRYAGKVVKE